MFRHWHRHRRTFGYPSDPGEFGDLENSSIILYLAFIHFSFNFHSPLIDLSFISHSPLIHLSFISHSSFIYLSLTPSFISHSSLIHLQFIPNSFCCSSLIDPSFISCLSLIHPSFIPQSRHIARHPHRSDRKCHFLMKAETKLEAKAEVIRNNWVWK